MEKPKVGHRRQSKIHPDRGPTTRQGRRLHGGYALAVIERVRRLDKQRRVHGIPRKHSPTGGLLQPQPIGDTRSNSRTIVRPSMMI